MLSRRHIESVDFEDDGINFVRAAKGQHITSSAKFFRFGGNISELYGGKRSKPQLVFYQFR